MRVCFISDTHTKHRDLTLPEADLLVHCGDLTYFNQYPLDALDEFNSWVLEQKASGRISHAIAIPGNHDKVFDPAFTASSVIDRATRALSDVELLIDSSTTFRGLRVHGSPATPWFFDWAFNRDSQQIRSHWSKISVNTDILVTHGPPEGVFDSVGQRRVGCPALLRTVQKIQPKVHAFGHIHRTGLKTENGTTFINASSVNEDRVVTHKPYVVDL